MNKKRISLYLCWFWRVYYVFYVFTTTRYYCEKENRRKCGFSEGADFDEVGKLVKMLLVTDAEKVNTGSIVSIEIKKIVLIVFRK